MTGPKEGHEPGDPGSGQPARRGPGRGLSLQGGGLITRPLDAILSESSLVGEETAGLLEEGTGPTFLMMSTFGP